MNKSILGLYYEDFVIGDEIQHSLSKTIFESDNNFFSLLTMNHHPVHTNMDYAAKKPTRKNSSGGYISIFVGCWDYRT